jgi:hypothetical protein
MMQSEPAPHCKNDGSSRYASNIRARSTRLAGSVLEWVIDLNFAESASPSDSSIDRRHAAMSFNPSSQSH